MANYPILGRSDDSISRDGKIIYLFELKESISSINGVQECEIIVIQSNNKNLITAHIVLNNEYRQNSENIIKNIFKLFPEIDGVKLYDFFGINATSGKCDKDAMAHNKDGYLQYKDEVISVINF